jgi:hypothetical protein
VARQVGQHNARRHNIRQIITKTYHVILPRGWWEHNTHTGGAYSSSRSESTHDSREGEQKDSRKESFYSNTYKTTLSQHAAQCIHQSLPGYQAQDTKNEPALGCGLWRLEAQPVLLRFAIHCAVQFTVLCNSLCCAIHCAVQFTVLCNSLCCAIHCAVQFTVLCNSLCFVT